MLRSKKKTEAIVDAALAERLTKARVEAQAMLEACSTMALSTQADIDLADLLLTKTHELLKRLDLDRSEKLAPFESIIAAQKALYKPIEECLASCKAILKERILARQKASETQVDLDVAAGVTTVGPIASTAVTEREYWTCEVVNEDEVPDCYWRLDMASLDKQAGREKADFNVPGCRPVRRVKGVMS